ncbi:MAG: hypothetical protein AAGJ28_21615 [Pseudomonadota bacterium]
MSPRELTQELYTGLEHLVPADGIDERVNALYAPEDGETGRIYILSAAWVARWDGSHGQPYENPYFREMLLHELIHHFQHVSGRSAEFPCIAFGEQEAYLQGGVYLRERNVTDPLPNRHFWAAVYSRC